MMCDARALKVAIELVHVPSRVRLIRSGPLPAGLLVLLRIAAGDQDAENEAIELTGRSRVVVRDAAAFFIEQILLNPHADSYRVLGAGPQATHSELRRNMALLIRWLHPDLDRRGERSLFAGRVTGAWNDLKTPERRAAYDEARRTLATRSLLGATRGAHARCWHLNHGAQYERWGMPSRSLDVRKIERAGLVRRVLFFLMGGARR